MVGAHRAPNVLVKLESRTRFDECERPKAGGRAAEKTKRPEGESRPRPGGNVRNHHVVTQESSEKDGAWTWLRFPFPAYVSDMRGRARLGHVMAG